MLFTEFRFFIFFAIVFGIYWMLPGNRQRKVLLLIGSYIFYAAWNPKFLALIIASTIIDFFIGLKLGSLAKPVRETTDGLQPGKAPNSPARAQAVRQVLSGGEAAVEGPLPTGRNSIAPGDLPTGQPDPSTAASPSLRIGAPGSGRVFAQGYLDYRAAESWHQRHLWIALSVCWNLGVLFFFKYFNFGIDSAQHLLSWLGLHPSIHTLNIILPVGISFFTFQSMSYSIDIYRGTLEPCRDLLDFSTFIGFFPQLFSGPIVRAIDFLPQLKTPRRLENVRGRAMVMMFIIGYIKKACVADNLAPFVDDYFANPGHYNWLGCWTAVLFYAAQIYCDFSGYTDMAIASAGLLGFEFCQNFDFPYFSPNIAEFWRRWHMSLSSWLRDYLYIPLGGNRGGKLFQHRNLFLTMLLGGLWHGAAWTFVVWGAMHGGGLIVHREFRNWLKQRKRISNIEHPTSNIQQRKFSTSAIVGTIFTFLWVALTWIFFRATKFGTALQTAKSFVLFHSPGSADFGINCVIAFGVLVVIHWIAHCRWLHAWWSKVPAWQFAAICGVILATALPWTPLRYQPFIYFQF